MRRAWDQLSGLVLVLASFLLASGCDNAVEPLAADAESFVFLNGFLDSAADSQFVRLEGLRSSVLGEPRELGNLLVTSRDNNDGLMTTWRDSLVTLDDGEPGHLYFALFRPTAGHTYDLVVRHLDEQPATATTTIPSTPVVSLSEPEGSIAIVLQGVLLVDQFEAPAHLQMRYEVSIPETGEIQNFVIDYGQAGRANTRGWDLDVFLRRDQQIISFMLGRTDADSSLGLRKLSLEAVLNSDEWRDRMNPSNLFLAEGFFGSIGRFGLSWRLDPNVVMLMGFNDEQDLGGGKE